MPPPQFSQDSQRLLGCHIIVCCQQAIQEVLDASVQLLVSVLLIGSLDVCSAASVPDVLGGKQVYAGTDIADEDAHVVCCVCVTC